MTIFEILISVAVLILLFHLYSRFTRWIRKLITKFTKKKQVEKDSAYCLLRLAVNGELTHFLYDDEQSARQSYLAAVNFNEDNGSYIALFQKAILIEANTKN